VIRQLLKKETNNHYLDPFLDNPSGLKEVFRVSRILFKDLQHLILIGESGCGKYEYLQISAVTNKSLILEVNCPKFGEPS
jgi:ABC-type nitrate/sulfonate/bicarbonate transport system ATPase subunit